MSHVLVISPPFYSHVQPLTAVGRALAARGARVTFACVDEFKTLAADNGLEFVAFEATSNRNTGLATATEQPEHDRERLHAFLRAVREGAVPALLQQNRNRRADMFHDPQGVMAAVRDLCEQVRPDWCLIDHLGFPVILAMYCTGTPFATLVAGHPTELQRGSRTGFGVPDRWPDEVYVDRARLPELHALAQDVERTFTDAFNSVVRTEAPQLPGVDSAFGFGSPHARIFLYPESAWRYARQDGRDLFAGHCTRGTETLPDAWTAELERLRPGPLVLVAFGTFHRGHTDVMRLVHEGVRRALPDAGLVLAAGDRAGDLADLAGVDGSRTLVHDFVPQRALLPHLDLVVHHGGINSFSEAIAAGVPALVAPFSGDQFDAAADVARLGIGGVLDPNHLDPDTVAAAVRAARGADVAGRTRDLALEVTARGPDWVAQQLIERMSRTAGAAERG
jgi:UDP:flavonoid glycosyltransferase YjiC (YdhE family)